MSVEILYSIFIFKNHFVEMILDFIETLVSFKGFDIILVMIDRLMNYFKFEPIHFTVIVADITDLIYRSWYRQFEFPKIITSNRNKLFTSEFWKKLHKWIQVDLYISIFFHSEIDDFSERFNKTMIEVLCYYVNLWYSDWTNHLIHMKVAMNNSVNATIEKTSTEMIYETSLRLFLSFRDLAKVNLDISTISDYIQHIQENITLIRNHHAKIKMKQIIYANQKR